MKKRRSYVASLVVILTFMTVPVLSDQNQSSAWSPSELQTMSILKDMGD